MGRVSKDGTHFIGEKKNVTSDVLGAIVEKAAFHGGQFDVVAGSKKWIVTVTEVKT